MSGKTILDLKKTKEIRLQPSIDSFVSTFEVLTDGLLKGLNWGAEWRWPHCLAPIMPTMFRNTKAPTLTFSFVDSDLSRRVEQIYDTWLSNLPPNSYPHVLRNSRTITYGPSHSTPAPMECSIECYIRFLADYPIKRVQIILKLVESPKEVLLKFDLDPCSMGFDGKELWLLPRAALALQSESLSLHIYSFSPVI
jgi:hypothetical protein